MEFLQEGGEGAEVIFAFWGGRCVGTRKVSNLLRYVPGRLGSHNNVQSIPQGPKIVLKRTTANSYIEAFL